MIRAPRLGLFSVFALALFITGCEEPAVGDPCMPEVIPPGGFQRNESYVEVNSVQCRTRVCLVHQFSGDPRNIEDETCDGPTTEDGAACFTRGEIEEAIFCSCRCSASGDSSAPTCSCPDGFICQDEIVTVGDEGVVGGYCVRDPSASVD